MQFSLFTIHDIVYVAPEGYEPLDFYPTSCGAGRIGDLLIPDHIFGVDLRPACHIHDYSWQVARPDRYDFEISNKAFLLNMRNAILKCHTGFRQNAAQRIARIYYEAVDGIIGWQIFMDEKGMNRIKEDVL